MKKNIKKYIAEIGMFITMILLIVLTVIAYSSPAYKKKEASEDYEIIRYKQDYADVETNEIETHKAAEEETTAKTKYYQVPLDTVLQDYIFTLCEREHINPAFIIAIIERESNYCSTAVGDYGNSIGLMQINLRWQKGRCEQLGVYDLTDPRQNVTVGLDVLHELFEQSEDLTWVLMAYNGGPEYADNKIQNGIYETEYTHYVIERMQELDAERE